MGKAIEKAETTPRTLRSSATDEALLLRYREQGDSAAFDELVHRYERELFGYLKHYLGDASLAEDLFQATFLQLHRKCHQYQKGRRVRPWLYSIATHLAIDAMRKAGRMRAVSLDAPSSDKSTNSEAGTLLDILESDTPGPLLQAEEHERNQRIREAVDQLPEDFRIVAVLVFFLGMKYSEVAEILEIPLGTVKSRVHAALVKLHTTWMRTHSEQD